MGRGLGKQQKTILRIVSANDGAKKEHIYLWTKKKLNPGIVYNINRTEIIEQSTSAVQAGVLMWLKETELRQLKKDTERAKALNRVRVSVHNSIRGLVERGCIEVRREGTWGQLNIYITDKGKQLLNPNVVAMKQRWIMGK